MTKIDLEKIKILNIKKGDIVVLESAISSSEIAKKMVGLLKCKVILVDDIDKIGILKFKN